MPFKYHLVLATDQMGVHQRQAAGQHPLAHALFTLVTLADMKRRCVDHRQQLGTGLCRQSRRCFKPGVLTDQQADPDPVARFTSLKYAHLAAWREIASLVKHLVIGQLALGVGGQHLPFAQHAGGIEALLHRDRAGAQITAGGVADYHTKVFQIRQRSSQRLHGLVARGDKRRPQKQVFGGVPANRQLRRQYQTRAVLVGAACRSGDFLHVAREVTDHQVELGDCNFQRHAQSTTRWVCSPRPCTPSRRTWPARRNTGGF